MRTSASKVPTLGRMLTPHLEGRRHIAPERRVVIVYSERWVYEALHAMATRTGFDVVGVPCASLDHVGGRTLQPDVVILQVPEPVGEYREVAVAVRRRWPASAFVVVGGHQSDAHFDARTRHLGARCILRRPFSQKVLTQVILEAAG